MQQDAITDKDRFAIKVVMLINSFDFKDSEDFSFHAIKNENDTITLPSRIVKDDEPLKTCIDSLLSEYLVIEKESPIDCKLVDVIDTFSNEHKQRVINLVFNITLNRKDNHYFHKSLSIFDNKEIFEIIDPEGNHKERISTSDAAAILMSVMEISRQVQNG